MDRKNGEGYGKEFRRYMKLGEEKQEISRFAADRVTEDRDGVQSNATNRRIYGGFPSCTAK